MVRFAVSQRELDEVKEHIATTNHELGYVKEDVEAVKVSLARIENDVGWLKTYLPPLVIIVTVFGAIISYIFKD